MRHKKWLYLLSNFFFAFLTLLAGLGHSSSVSQLALRSVPKACKTTSKEDEPHFCPTPPKKKDTKKECSFLRLDCQQRNKRTSSKNSVKRKLFPPSVKTQTTPAGQCQEENFHHCHFFLVQTGRFMRCLASARSRSNFSLWVKKKLWVFLTIVQSLALQPFFQWLAVMTQGVHEVQWQPNVFLVQQASLRTDTPIPQGAFFCNMPNVAIYVYLPLKAALLPRTS